MKHIIDCQAARGLAALAWLGCALPLAAADAPVRYQALPTNTLVRIQGTSTAHDWEMKGAIIGGFVEFDAGVQFDTAQAAIAGLKEGKLSATAHANIPIRSIHSEADHLPDVMDNLMQEAMKEPQFKRIEYRVSELKLKEPHAPGQPFEFDAKGELTIAGVTNKVAFPVAIQPVGKEQIKISGAAPVKMSDYGIKPPAPNFGLGLMRCGDDVKVIFDWTLVRKNP